MEVIYHLLASSCHGQSEVPSFTRSKDRMRYQRLKRHKTINDDCMRRQVKVKKLITPASQQTTWWQNCCLHCADYPTKLRNVCGSSSLKVPACTSVLLLTAVFVQYTHFHLLLNTSLVSASQTVPDLSRLITCNCNFLAGVIHVIGLHSIYRVSIQKCHNCKYYKTNYRNCGRFNMLTNN